MEVSVIITVKYADEPNLNYQIVCSKSEAIDREPWLSRVLSADDFYHVNVITGLTEVDIVVIED